MTIAVIGAGAIGSVVAGYLSHEGVDVTLIGRQDQVDAINEKGLHIAGIRGEQTFKLKAQAQLDQEYDLVIFTVKTQDIEEAFKANEAFLKNCLILSSQNGVQSDEIFAKFVDKERHLSSIVMFGSTFIQPGEVTFNFEGDWIIGKPYAEITDKDKQVVEVLGKAFNIVESNDIVGMKWLKLFVNFNNCIPALVGKSMQETFADLDLCRLSILLLKEGVDIIQKADIHLESLPQFPSDRIFGLVNMPIEQASGIINQTLTKLSDEPLYGSILQSIMRRKSSEIDFINGEVVSLANKLKGEAPLNNKIVNLVHGVEDKHQFLDFNEVKQEFNLN